VRGKIKVPAHLYMMTSEELAAALDGTKNRSSSFVGMTRSQVARYSLARVLRKMVKNESLDGIEAEMDQEIRLQRPGNNNIEGVGIPFDVLQPTFTRDLNVNTFGQGGAFVESTVSPSVIPLLRNKTSVIRLGATVLDGLTGNVLIPRETDPATVSQYGEIAAALPSTPTLDQVALTPHRSTASVQYSRQLVLQSSVSVENFLRDDLTKQIGIKLDYLALAGNGAASEPMGIMNTTGIGSLIFGGAASWAGLLAFEQSLAAMNADSGKMGWVVSTADRNRWKQIAKTGTGVTTTVPIFLWDEKNQIQDGSNDCYVNGYRATATNQIPNNQALFGNFEDLIIGIWGKGLDIIVNPYSLDTQAEIRITVHQFCDIGLRHPVSFCVSADSGAQ
jgi:HK97 family phage major capsid protein